MLCSFVVSIVRLLGRYQGRNGQIEIVECSWDGTRVYFEEGVRQSQATPNGESVFTYVKIMDELLSRSEHILVLGCGGGNLATRLSRLGKRLTIIDNNPISFVLAHRYFDLPDDLPCIVSDFRRFVFDDRAYYDGIAIDVGGPGFRFAEEFDAETCEAIRARLAPGGRIVMNVTVSNDIDPTPDRIAARLAGEELRTSNSEERRFASRTGARLFAAPITAMGPTTIRSNNRSGRPAHRVAKTCIDKRPADRVAVLFRKALAARHLVPRAAHLRFHIGHDFLGFAFFKQEAQALRDNVFGIGVTPGVPADHRKVAALLTNVRCGREIVCRRELPIHVHSHEGVVSRMIVGVRNQRVKAHSPEQLGSVGTGNGGDPPQILGQKHI